MQLCDINPFMRYAELQPSVLSSAPSCRAYDYRIFYVVEGNADFIYTDRTVPVRAGTLIYFRPGVPYYFDGKVKVIVINFDMTRNQSHKKKALNPLSYLHSFDRSLIFENDPPSELSELIVVRDAFKMEGKMRKCIAYYDFPSAISDAASSALIKEILCYMASAVSYDREDVPELVKKVLMYIRQNYDKDVSNSSIAEHFNYHEFYLNRIFKKSTGRTIHQALIAERIRVASSLLRGTELSVEEIASEVGFSNRSQFCTAFKKQTEVTPTEYRKRKIDE